MGGGGSHSTDAPPQTNRRSGDDTPLHPEHTHTYSVYTMGLSAEPYGGGVHMSGNTTGSLENNLYRT